MEGLAPKLKLSDPELQKRAETVPLLLKGEDNREIRLSGQPNRCDSHVFDVPSDMLLI